MNEICYNRGHKNHLYDDPRVGIDYSCDSFRVKSEEYKKFPKVCGNCIFYTVQDCKIMNRGKQNDI